MATMDVDVNWMDFVLDGSKLIQYLQESSETKVLDLLESFIDKLFAMKYVPRNPDPLDVSQPEQESPPPSSDKTEESPHSNDKVQAIVSTGEDNSTDSKKSKVLQTLAFRTAAFLNWNLEVLSRMSIDTQFLLLTYLKDCFGQTDPFCRALFHKWMLRSTTLDPNHPCTSSISNSGILLMMFDNLKRTTKELEESADPGVLVPTFDSVRYDGTLDKHCHYELPVSVFLSSLYYDLAIFALRSPVIHDIVAVEYFQKLRSHQLPSCPFVSISSTKLNVYLALLGITNPDEPEVDLGNTSSTAVSCVETIRSKYSETADLTECYLPLTQGLTRTDKAELKFTLIEELKRATDPIEIESLVFHINQHPDIPESTISSYFPTDIIPDAFAVLIASLQSRQVHDVLYSTIANGLILLKMKRYNEFTKCFDAARSSIRNNISKSMASATPSYIVQTFRKIEMQIGWEHLLGDINRAFDEWSTPQIFTSLEELTKRSEQTVRAFQAGKTSHSLPRKEVVEAALALLLNCGKFELVVSCSRVRHGWPFLEFLTLVARIGVNVQNATFFSSNFRDVWNAVLPIVSLSAGVKRRPEAEGILANVTALKWILSRAKSSNMVKIFVSALAKLHNFYCRDQGSECSIQVDLLEHWPNFLDDVCDSSGLNKSKRVAGTSNLNIVLIRELLVELLEAQRGSEELVYLKLRGNVYLYGKKPFAAMKCYVEYLAQATHSFEMDYSPVWKDDDLFQRMIKASCLLGSFLQGSILCQFQTTPDYHAAFGMASNLSSKEDWEGLYEFIWDMSILEYIASFFSKRKAYFERRNAVVRIIRQLELNDHNNEEIKRAAIRLRKINFMRTLVNIYLLE